MNYNWIEDDLNADEMAPFGKFLKEYPGDSINEQKRSKKAYILGFEVASRIFARRIAKTLRAAAKDIDDAVEK